MADDALSEKQDEPTTTPIPEQAAAPAPANPGPGTPAPATPAADASAPEGEGDGKLDPQLVGMAVVLWVLAMAIFVFKWDRLRVDWYLGNIKETGELSRKLDEPSITALVELASGDPAIVRMVGEEVVGPLANADPFYRMAVVRTLERVPGPEALELLSQAAAGDLHGAVRANAYRALGARAKAEAAEREPVVRLLEQRLAVTGGEQEPAARAFALEVAADLGARELLWPAIREVRAARGTAPAVNREAAEAGEKLLREKGAAAFYALSGTTKEQLPFDPAADLATRDAQVRAWEAWFVQQGGTIPPDETFEKLHPPAKDSQGPEGPTQGQPQ